MAEENQKLQVLDAHGLDIYTKKLKNESFTPKAHTHEAEDLGMEAIPDATIEAIISGTWNPDE